MRSRPARTGFLAFLAFLAASPAAAHPGTGIVEDRSGNIYYTDLERVWRLAPDGTRSVAVPGVHTHELYLDPAGNLYGEHAWYEGDATGKWGWRIWRRRPDGAIETVVPPTEGFRKAYSFVRDAAGTMYWPEGSDGLILRQAPGAAASPAASSRFGAVRSMAVRADGTLYLIDGEDLVRILPSGAVRRVARNLAERRHGQPFVNPHHRLMGLWSDPAGNVYVAVWGAQMVKRVDPEGRVTVAARSTFPWSPTGGLVARDGRLWLLEYSVTNAVRVRPADAPGSPPWVWALFALAAFVLLALPLAVYRARRGRKCGPSGGFEQSAGPR
ncbi:MAG TPA: hypothetical protein VFZ91_16185 [Allosphingosinicella sp.]